MTTIKDRLIRVFGNFLFAIAIIGVACLLPLSVSSYSDEQKADFDFEDIESIEVKAEDSLIFNSEQLEEKSR